MTNFNVRRRRRRAAYHFNSPSQLTDGDGGTALDEAESGILLVERGFADYILAPGDAFLASSEKSAGDFSGLSAAKG
jgi:hypothetical protein